MSQQGNDSDLYFSAELQDNVSPTADQIVKKLQQLGATKAEISMYLKAYDEATPKIKAAQDQINKLPKHHLITVQAATDQAHQALNKLKKVAEAPITVTVKVKDTFDDYIRDLRGRASNMEMQLKQSLRSTPLLAGLIGATGQVSNSIAGSLSGLTGIPMTGLGAGMGLAGGAAATTAFFAKSMELNSQMEQNIAQLTNMLRSPSAAQQELSNVSSFNLKTPFQLQDVLGADIKLRSIGTNPMNQAVGLPASTNLAAGTGTTVAQAQQAISSAALGYFEQLNTLTGRNITQRDFTYGGRYSGQTYQQAITDTMKQYQGASIAQMQTFKGLSSNIHDIISQRFIAPAGQGMFGAAKGMETSLANTLSSPGFQTKMADTVDHLQSGITQLFQLLQRGKDYFSASLAQPLKDIAKNVTSVGVTFAKTFGAQTLTLVKYLAQGLTTVVQPLSDMGSKLPIVTELIGKMKAFQTLHINSVSRFGAYELVKSILDMKNANDQLNSSFKTMGQSSGDELDKLKAKFDSMVLSAAMLGKSIPQAKAYAAGVAATLAPGLLDGARNPRTLGNAAVTGSKDIMQMSYISGIGGQQMKSIFDQYLKSENAAGMINKGMSPSAAMNKVAGDIMQAGHELQNTLHIDLGTAIKDASTSLQMFSQQLSKAGMNNPQGGALAAGLDASLRGTKDYGAYGQYPGGLVGTLLSNAVAPSYNVLHRALYHPVTSHSGPGHQAVTTNRNELDQAFSWWHPSGPNIYGSHTNDMAQTLRSYTQMPIDAAKANTQFRNMLGGGIGKGLGISLPQQSNPLVAMGLGNIPTTSAGIKGMSNSASVKALLELQNAANSVGPKIQSINQELVQYEATLDKFSIAQEQASGALAQSNLGFEKQLNQIGDMQNALQAYTLNAVNPLQRAMAALSQKSADYQQKNMVPLSRAQEDWNQTMQLTSYHLEDVSHAMQNAQFNMDKFSGGMLTGENAMNKQIQSMSVYMDKLQMIQALNMGIGSDITQNVMRQGFSSTIHPMTGFDLQAQMQMAQNKSQYLQAKDAATFGNEHWQMQMAARPLFQRMEMGMGQRMKGILNARSVIDTSTLSTHDIQNLQYQESLKQRLLQEQMYHVTVGERGLQDQQYALNKQMFGVQQNVSLKSDQIAKATLAIAVAQKPLQDKIRGLNDYIGAHSPAIDKKIQEKTMQLGNLQNLVPELQALQGALSGNIDQNIKGGSFARGHLKNIGDDMALSADSLKRIAGVLTGLGGGGGGGRGGPSRGLGGGPPWTHALTAIPALALNAPQWIGGAADWASNSVNGLTHSSGLGLAAGIAGGIGAGLVGFNAADVLLTHARAPAIRNTLGRLPGVGSWVNKAVERDLASAPWKRLLTPSALIYDRFAGMAAGGLVGLGAHELGVGPTGTALATVLASTLASQHFGKGAAEAGPFAFRGTKAAARGVWALGSHLVTDPISAAVGHDGGIVGRLLHGLGALIMSPFRTVGRGMASGTKGIFATAVEGASDKAASAEQIGTKIAEKMATTGGGTDTKPFRVIIMDAAKYAVSGAASIGDNARVQRIFNSAPVQGITDRVSTVRTTLAEDPVAKSWQDSAKSFAGSVKEWGTSQLQDARHRANSTGKAEQVVKDSATAASDWKKAAAEPMKLVGTKLVPATDDLVKAAQDSGKAASKFGEFTSKFGPMLRNFSGKASLFSTAVGIFELLPPSLKKAIEGPISTFARAVKDGFATAISKFGGFITDQFKGAIHDFKTIVSDVQDIVHILKPATKTASDVSHAANVTAATARTLGDAKQADALDGALERSPALRKILKQAQDVGAKVVNIGGKVFDLGTKAMGVAAFLPGTIDAFHGRWGAAASKTVDAGSYFVPGLGEARMTTDLYNIMAGILGATADKNAPKVTGGNGQKYYNPRVAPFASQSGNGLYVDSIQNMQKLAESMGIPTQTVQNASFQQLQQFLSQVRNLYASHNKNLVGAQGNFLNLNNQQATKAYDDALNGPNGLVQYLKSINTNVNAHWNSRLQSIASGFTSEQATTQDGFKAIGQTTASWLTALSKQIHNWAKSMGLHISDGNTNAQPSAPNIGALPANQQIGAGKAYQLANGFAHGGVVEADKHKVGPGRMVRMVEEGHPEVVIPLAPHRRDRAKSLVKQLHGTLGMANGGYVDPFPQSGIVPERVDMGVDYNAPAGTLIRAIGDAHVYASAPHGTGWNSPMNTQAFVGYTLSGGPQKGKSIFVAEDIIPLVQQGAAVKAGQAIAKFIGSSTGIETGWGTGAGYGPLAGALNQQDPGKDPGGWTSAAGASFNSFLVSLGAPSGLLQGGGVHGSMKGVPFAIGATSNVTPIHLKAVPAMLKKLGIAGAYQSAIAKHLSKQMTKHLDAMSSQSTSSGGFLTGFSGGGNAIANEKLGKKMAAAMGWKGADWNALLSLWMGESNWNQNAKNPSSGAYGIPQSLPANKMAAAGPDWLTNPATQIAWGLNYIKGTYQNPSNAYAKWLSRSPHWYAGGNARVTRDEEPAILHKDEMVVPAAVANAARAMAGNGMPVPTGPPTPEKRSSTQRKSASSIVNKILKSLDAVLLHIADMHKMQKDTYLKALMGDVSKINVDRLKSLMTGEIVTGSRKYAGIGGQASLQYQSDLAVANNAPTKDYGYQSIPKLVTAINDITANIAAATKKIDSQITDLVKNPSAAVKEIQHVEANVKNLPPGIKKQLDDIIANLKSRHPSFKHDTSVLEKLLPELISKIPKGKRDSFEKAIAALEKTIKQDSKLKSLDTKKLNEAIKGYLKVMAKTGQYNPKTGKIAPVAEAALLQALKGLPGIHSDKQMLALLNKLGINVGQIKTDSKKHHNESTKQRNANHNDRTKHNNTAHSASTKQRNSIHGAATKQRASISAAFAKLHSMLHGDSSKQRSSNHKESMKQRDAVSNAHLALKKSTHSESMKARGASDVIRNGTLGMVTQHVGIASKHLSTAQSHLALATGATKDASDYHKGYRGDYNKTQKTNQKHQGTIEKQFDTMITHLNRAASRLEGMSMHVSNNITISTSDPKTAASVKQSYPRSP